jgi:hypothetical protein
MYLFLAVFYKCVKCGINCNIITTFQNEKHYNGHICISREALNYRQSASPSLITVIQAIIIIINMIIIIKIIIIIIFII